MKYSWLSLGVSIVLGVFLQGCPQTTEISQRRITIGVVSYEQVGESQQQYESFKNYIAEQTQSYVVLEPTFNELQAIDQIQRQEWSLVFAPAGLSAIAISEQQYIPAFALQNLPNLRSAIVVRDESEVDSIEDLSNRVIALGEVGSATGYYLPLYDLYGLTLEEIRFAPTPKTLLSWLDTGEIEAGALSEQDFQTYRDQFRETEFRVIHKTRAVPPGMVLFNPTLDSDLRIQLTKLMKNAPPDIVQDAGYLPNANLPDYEQFIKFVEKVRPLEEQVREMPAVLVKEAEDVTPNESEDSL